MKRILIWLLGLVVVLALGSALFLRFGLGVPLASPGVVFDIAGGMGAKLGCSARYITGLDAEQVKEDLKSYSSLYENISITNDDERKQVSARFAPGDTHSATYRPGIGCSLDIGDVSALDKLDASTWLQPQSDPATHTGTADALLQAQLNTDNELGLQTRALLLMQNGEVIGEAYSEGFDENTPHLGWSMGKSLIAILFGRLEETSNLLVSQTSLFEQWHDDRKNLKIEHLLTMTSGLEFGEVYAPGSDATRMLFNEYSASNVALEKPLLHPPGTQFAYSSGTTNMLSRFLFDQLGGTAENAYEFLHNELLNPLGLTNTVVEPDPSGVFVGSSYVYASARDWARLGSLLVADGRHNGKRLLTSDWIKRATTPNSSTNEPRYGYQFWLNRGGDELRWPDLPEDALAMQGNRAQIVLMIPSQKLVLVRLGWTAGGYPYNQTFSELLAKVP